MNDGTKPQTVAPTNIEALQTMIAEAVTERRAIEREIDMLNARAAAINRRMLAAGRTPAGLYAQLLREARKEQTP